MSRPDPGVRELRGAGLGSRHAGPGLNASATKIERARDRRLAASNAPLGARKEVTMLTTLIRIYRANPFRPHCDSAASKHTFLCSFFGMTQICGNWPGGGEGGEFPF